MAKLSPIGRASFPELFQPTQVSGQGAFKYRLTLLIDPKDPALAQLRADIEESAKKKWPSGRPKNWSSPLLDGDDMDNPRPECAGMIVLRLTANDDRPPQVVDSGMRPITKESGKMYSGCYARASYNCFSWTNTGKNGTSVGMNNVQVVRDGDPLDSRTNASDDFDALPESEMAVTPGDDDSQF